MSSILRVGEFLDYLKEQGMYDNTRIIVVADHGLYFREFDELAYSEKLYAGKANPILIYKDFKDDESETTGITTSWEFMTNADTPELAVKGIIKNPTNPYKKQTISSGDKDVSPQVITWSGNFDLEDNDGYTWNTDDDYWWSVHDNIYDKDNWQFVAEGSVKIGKEEH